jgi:N-dimethylarginine dimethylaminohydrolase
MAASYDDDLVSDPLVERSAFPPAPLRSSPPQGLDVLTLDNRTPTTLQKPAFLMNCPFSYNTTVPNNAWMRDLADPDRAVDRGRALSQFFQLYNFLAAESVVYLLPEFGQGKLQDLVFTANLGIVLEHLPEPDVAVVSNYTSEPRRGETEVGRAFFQAMGYRTVVAPHKFEGEAELKHLHDNVYVGGYGIRSEREVYDWMEDEFDMIIVKVAEADEYLYHLDCSIFPVASDRTLVCTELFEKRELSALEQHTEIIDVTADVCYSGICNSVRLHNLILNASNIHSLKAGTEAYQWEVQKNRALEDIAARLGMEVTYFDLSEFQKGGALLSCMLMHLNRRSYAFSLI